MGRHAQRSWNTSPLRTARRSNSLLTALLARRLLAELGPDQPLPGPDRDGEESGLDVFYWEFGTTAAQVQERLDTRHVAVLGINCISRQLVGALQAVGLRHLRVADHPLLRNRRMFREDELRADEWPSWLPAPLSYEEWRDTTDPVTLDCLVATADFGAQALMRSWNEFCVLNNRIFLPVVLDRLVGLVGPLVVPGETACYECLRAREDANREEFALRRALEQPTAAVQRQVVSGFHPSMATILGDLAAVELHKYYSLAMPYRVGTLFEVNLLSPSLTSRKVLKVPRCPVCSPLNKRPAVNPEKGGFLPGGRLSDPR